jgi:hypothetical protein
MNKPVAVRAKQREIRNAGHTLHRHGYRQEVVRLETRILECRINRQCRKTAQIANQPARLSPGDEKSLSYTRVTLPPFMNDSQKMAFVKFIGVSDIN